MTEAAVRTAPNEPAYYETLIKMFIATDQSERAKNTLNDLKRLNIGGRLSSDIYRLQTMFDQSVRNSG
jgi:hypothetical protein